MMPKIGYGTFLVEPGAAKALVVDAVLKHGYRHLDCAMIYGNEKTVGEAITEILAAGVSREELFITSKMWHTERNDPEKAL